MTSAIRNFLILALAAWPAFADVLQVKIDHFSGAFFPNWSDTEENAALLTFLEGHDGKVVFLSLTIDTSVSVEQQTQTMAACGLDPGSLSGASLLNRDLGFPTNEFGPLQCRRRLYIESARATLPQNGASTGIVWFNLDGFFFVRGTVHGDNPHSFHLRELAADAATWVSVEQNP